MADRSSAACLAVVLQRLHSSEPRSSCQAWPTCSTLSQPPAAGCPTAICESLSLAWLLELCSRSLMPPNACRPASGRRRHRRLHRQRKRLAQRRLALTVSSPRRAACTTTSRARWRTAPWSTPSSPPPTASSGWSLEARGLGGGNRDQGAQNSRTREQGPPLPYLVTITLTYLRCTVTP